MLLDIQALHSVPPPSVLQLSAVGSRVTVCFGQEDLVRSHAAGIAADELRFINQKSGFLCNFQNSPTAGFLGCRYLPSG